MTRLSIVMTRHTLELEDGCRRERGPVGATEANHRPRHAHHIEPDGNLEDPPLIKSSSPIPLPFIAAAPRILLPSPTPVFIQYDHGCGFYQ